MLVGITVALVFGVWAIAGLVAALRRHDRKGTVVAAGLMVAVIVVCGVVWAYMSALDAAVEVFL